MAKGKRIEMGIMGITVEGVSLGQKDRPGVGTITSTLHVKGEGKVLKAAWDAIESMILAHAVAGVDVTIPAYREGLEAAIDDVWNAYGN